MMKGVGIVDVVGEDREGREWLQRRIRLPRTEDGPDGVEKVDISRPETKGRGMAVEKIREVGRGQVVEGFEGEE